MNEAAQLNLFNEPVEEAGAVLRLPRLFRP